MIAASKERSGDKDATCIRASAYSPEGFILGPPYQIYRASGSHHTNAAALLEGPKVVKVLDAKEHTFTLAVSLLATSARPSTPTSPACCALVRCSLEDCSKLAVSPAVISPTDAFFNAGISLFCRQGARVSRGRAARGDP